MWFTLTNKDCAFLGLVWNMTWDLKAITVTYQLYRISYIADDNYSSKLQSKSVYHYVRAFRREFWLSSAPDVLVFCGDSSESVFTGTPAGRILPDWQGLMLPMTGNRRGPLGKAVAPRKFLVYWFNVLAKCSHNIIKAKPFDGNSNQTYISPNSLHSFAISRCSSL